MSEVIEGQPLGMTAGNTNANLAGNDRDAVVGLPSSADLDAVASEVAIAEATGVQSTDEANDDPLDEENTFDVSRAEFSELRDAFLRLMERVKKYNIGASHKI